MATESARKQRVREVWQASWGRGDVDALDELLDPSYRRHTASGGTPQSRDGFKASILSTREAFPNLMTTIEEMVEEGDRLAIRWRSTGTHTGTFHDVPPTGRDVEVFGVTFAHFTGSAVAEEWVTWDPLQLLTALGIIPLSAATRRST
ncbi:MAG: DUF4440 domain-containing protein [Actinophytocola sp.]|nr:DUF4440 domain-containing protein [Actinophytocola sp.]